MYRFLIIFFAICFYSCSINKFKVPVKGIPNLSFNIEQRIDDGLSAYYSIEYKKGSETIFYCRNEFLCGLHEEVYKKDFYANSYDSIIFLSFLDENHVYAIYDLKTNIGFPTRNYLNNDFELSQKKLGILMDSINNYNSKLTFVN